MKKFLLLILSCALCLFIFPTKAYAQDINANDTIVKYSREEVNQREQENLANLKTNNIQPFTDEIMYDWRSTGASTIVTKGVGYAANQPALGVSFSAPGGGFYWVDGGQKVTVNVSASVAGKLVSGSVGVSLGSVGGTGYFQQSPYVNRPCKLYVEKRVQIKEYAVYQKNKYQSNWTFLRYDYTYTDVGFNLKVYLV